MRIIPLFLLAVWAPCATSQQISVLPDGSWAVVTSSFGGTTVTPYDEYFGPDAEAMRGPINTAIENSLHDRFRWEAKLQTSGWFSNSCSAASENIINDVVEFNRLPPGWEIRQVGTLGNLTTVENVIADPIISTYNWWKGKGYTDEFDVLDPNGVINPPSYAHTTTTVKSPDGNYYIVDNWHGTIDVKKIYPVGDVPDDEFAEFLSTDPDETLNLDADYRLHLSGLGKYFDEEPGPDDPVNPPDVQIDTPPPSSEPVEVEVLTSADPNDKSGLLGVGESRYLASSGPMDYVVRFENLPTASAPAQEVLVRDTLDTRVLDLSTFQLGDIRFGGRWVRVPPGRTSYSTRVPLEEGPFVVLIAASLVQETGIVTWRFTTLDTTTGDLPFDPLDGFLPPNQNPPEGEGSVSFNVSGREDLPNGTEIRNQARIIFDLNEPIDTPPWVNTIDREAPTTTVTLDEVQTDSVFTVRWGGSDTGSGLREYDVYASMNGGDFYLWLRRTPAVEETFAGYDGAVYGFYAIGYDAVGNEEAGKTGPDATTAIAVSSESGVTSLPTEVELAAPFPNPASATRPVDIHFALPTAGNADLRIFDVRGREVAQLAEGPYSPGWHRISWSSGTMASGVYIVRLNTDERVLTRRITIVR